MEGIKMGKHEKNLCGKTRKVDDPYEIWVDEVNGWEWRVLKKYQGPRGEANNPYARWFVAAKSPLTDGRWEFGDTYIKDITWRASKIITQGVKDGIK
jgi:hypothetical protein